MKFLVYTEDKADNLPIRQANRAAHIAWLKAPNAVTLDIAGPWLDDAGIMRGSLLIVDAANKDAVMEWLAQDPYRAAGLTASTTVKAYNWAIGAPAKA